jgi:hypothetical protein
MCHNLCSVLTPPPRFSSLLGLGLNFCLQPLTTSTKRTLELSTNRFRRDIFTRMCFAHTDSIFSRDQLFIRSEWQPPSNTIPADFRGRVNQFLTAIKSKFKYKRVPSNLLLHQQRLLDNLASSEDFIVFPTDKNLGPAIIERSEYIKRALNDHLLDENTYCRLSPDEATTRIETIKQLIRDFIKKYERKITKPDLKFLERSLDVKDPFAHFYITAKIHKTPWMTRPIVSVSGSCTHGLGSWTDNQLKDLCRKLPSYLKSSVELKEKLLTLSSHDLSRAQLFTADAVSMYTNIDTDHAMKTIANFLRNSPLCKDVSSGPIIAALEIVMRNNLFQFGDTYWIQKTGTAMGTPPAPMYATLYYGIHELQFRPKFKSLLYYTRYIDDIFGIWITDNNADTDALNWNNFQDVLQYGNLTWIVSERQISVVFLDLRLTLDTQTSSISTCLYEKPLNLYLYLPPHSAHPPGVLRGLVTGNVIRICRLTSRWEDSETAIRTFYRRLTRRGYSPETLLPIFADAVKKAQTPRAPPNRDETTENCIFLHLPFNPRDPSSAVLQQTFRKNLLSPIHEQRLETMRNEHNAHLGIDRMIVAYHRPRNIKNLLFPRRFRENPLTPVSSFCTPTQNTTHTQDLTD